MTKLLIATGIFHPESGGPATYLYHLLPELQARGYEVRVLTFGAPSSDDEDYPYAVTKIPRNQPFPMRMLGYALAARPLLEWADAVYAHTLMLPLPRLPWEPHLPKVVKIVGDQAWERSIRLGWVPPTTDIDRFQYNRYRNPFVWLAKRARKHEIRRVNGVIVPSKYLQKMVVRWGIPSHRVEVVHNALPPTHETSSLSQGEARKQLGIPSDAKILLTVARLVPWKGIDDFILALDAVSDVTFIVAGDGDYRTQFEQYATERGLADRVQFLGRIPRDQVAVYMRAADYVGLYSGYEGLSHVIIESLSAGTPVIASHKGGNPEIIQDGVNGLLVPYDDPHALADTLRRAFASGEQARLAANTASGLERFDYDRMVLNTVGALESLFGH